MGGNVLVPISEQIWLDMNKDIRRLIREIEANGFTVDQGRSHLLIKNADGSGGTIASLPLTPGRGRWEQNLRSQLRARGVLK